MSYKSFIQSLVLNKVADCIPSVFEEFTGIKLNGMSGHRNYDVEIEGDREGAYFFSIDKGIVLYEKRIYFKAQGHFSERGTLTFQRLSFSYETGEEIKTDTCNIKRS